MKTLLRSATISVASIALVAGGATAASADATATDQNTTDAQTSRIGAAASAVDPDRFSVQSTFSSFRVNDGVLYRKTANQVKASLGIVFTKAPLSVTTQVSVNGKPRGSIALPYTNFIELPAAIGPGRVVLGPTTITYTDNTTEVLQNRSNPFQFRRDTFGSFKVRHKGKKITMSVLAQVRGSDGNKASAQRALIQYKKGSKWKSLKTVKLNSKGKATYKYSTKSKRSYRLVVKRTPAVQGMTIKLRKL